MSDPLAIELAPMSARSVSGSGDAVDIGALRTAARIRLEIEAVSGTSPSAVVELQTSQSSTAGWKKVRSFTATAVNRIDQTVCGLKRYVRIVWTLTGSDTPSVTFGMTGVAHVTYVQPERLTAFGVLAKALKDMPPETLAEQCVAASSECDGYLARRYTLPLTAWGPDLERTAGQIAVYEVIYGIRGIDPEGPDAILIDRAKDSRKWLERVGAGSISPPEIVDSTPTKRGSAARVHNRSSGSSEWDC